MQKYNNLWNKVSFFTSFSKAIIHFLQIIWQYDHIKEAEYFLLPYIRFPDNETEEWYFSIVDVVAVWWKVKIQEGIGVI